MLRGAFAFGTHAKLSRENGSPHHGQALIGAGASRPFTLKRRTRATAVSSRPSPVLPRRFGDAAEPTQRPISIGQSPSSRRLPLAFHAGSSRISSNAQTTPAARES